MRNFRFASVKMVFFSLAILGLWGCQKERPKHIIDTTSYENVMEAIYLGLTGQQPELLDELFPNGHGKYIAPEVIHGFKDKEADYELIFLKVDSAFIPFNETLGFMVYDGRLIFKKEEEYRALWYSFETSKLGNMDDASADTVALQKKDKNISYGLILIDDLEKYCEDEKDAPYLPRTLTVNGFDWAMESQRKEISANPTTPPPISEEQRKTLEWALRSVDHGVLRDTEAIQASEIYNPIYDNRVRPADVAHVPFRTVWSGMNYEYNNDLVGYGKVETVGVAENHAGALTRQQRDVTGSESRRKRSEHILEYGSVYFFNAGELPIHSMSFRLTLYKGKKKAKQEYKNSDIFFSRVIKSDVEILSGEQREVKIPYLDDFPLPMKLTSNNFSVYVELLEVLPKPPVTGLCADFKEVKYSH